VELYELTAEESARRLERLYAMRRRISEGGRVYAAGILALMSGLRNTVTNGNGNGSEPVKNNVESGD
jgi:hypothetical protein